ncbi:T9SS type A sorting domain-containing protein [Flavobacterium sp. SORGH_AS_0622]|uniref:T9SS type A sorting domain-containing protein n=1 Tax=Flavobacterium sp. SORGH_AS_0622 TaxID=3041772 RepID=UPI002788E775|nr:T9SS type A sorting domain-containing protein [Flavobacterium sp. SORGH_AS_0622]MDQ1167263.1 endonuclease/exonuclease/phosphatase family metal-dependent hydrolase [Flavobacterium sp. SORGH_AS_0622]
MKKLYFSRQLLLLLCFLGCFSGDLFAQTMPAPQKLPHSQNFNTLLVTDTSYPAGYQGWTAGTSNPTGESQFATSGSFGADRALVANSSASTSSGNFHNYNGKIGFLNTGSLDLTIGFAFDATGQFSIPVQYDAMTIRNPYGDGTNNRINEMILQYRVGTTASFTSVTGTLYSNNTTTQIGTGNTTPQNPKTINIILPAECDNQPVVQIRWISRQLSGGGSRPSFAIDNIKVGRDITAPINISGFPKANNVLAESFDFINKLDEAGKTYFVLLPGGSAAPTVAQVKAGQDSNGTAALQAGSIDIVDPAQEYTKTFSGLTLNTSYSVYSVSEDTSSNIQAVVNKVDVTTASSAVPVLTTSTASLDLGFSEANYEAKVLSYQVGAIDLTQNVVLTSTANFTISKDNSTFASSLTFVPSDFASNATPTIYVKFIPNAVANFTGQITHELTGAVTKTVTLTGTGINPYKQDFNDSNVLTNSGWTQYNEAGPVNKWSYTSVARNVNSGTGAVLINGFSDNGPSKDWLISPKLRLDNFGALPLLSFYSRKFYAGPSLKLMVSTNYDGVSNPNTATWTEINGAFPTVTGTYAQSQYIKLDNYKTSNTYLAWVYETTSGGNTNASEWSFDDFAVTNEIGYVDSNPVLDFGVVLPNTVSDSQSFNFKAEGYGDITITTPASYQISADNVSFVSSIVITAADALAGKTLYAKFAPTVKEFKISGALTVTGTSLNKQIGSLTGSSLPKADTFDVVTYNLEFFGAPTSAYGPSDKPLQLENVAKVMNKLDADVYVVQEVSSDAQIDALIQKINVNGKTFEKSISNVWSYSWQNPPSDPNFPPQKLVVLYNTQTVTVKKTRVMFDKFYTELRNGTKTLNNYPGDSNSNFFSSGRLPYMVTIETNLNGVKNEINLIDLHARANSGTDISRYNMRKYDTQVLKDSLDAHYANSNIILLGDYNDDVKASVIEGQPSSYEAFVTDTNNYKALTLEISQAGAYSFLSSGGFLDHITISNELIDDYISNSTAVYDPRNDIANYTTTTSDHGPVIARFQLKQDVLSTPDFEKNKYYVKAYPNPAIDVLNFDVKTTQGRDLKIRLYDFNGRVIGNPISVKNESEVSTAAVAVGNLVSGVYFYTVTENNKVIFKDKILKK